MTITQNTASRALKKGIYFFECLVRFAFAPTFPRKLARRPPPPCFAEARTQAPGNTLPGFDDTWQPRGASALALEALDYGAAATPFERHAVRIDLALAYLRVIKRLDITITDTRPEGHVSPTVQLYGAVQEIVEDADGPADQDPALSPSITCWAVLLDPEELSPLAGDDVVLSRNKPARHKAYCGILDLVLNKDGAGGPRFAYIPFGARRFHFVALQDCVRMLYPPHGTKVSGWHPGIAAKPKAPKTPKQKGGDTGEASAPRRKYNCRICKVPLAGHQCPHRNKPQRRLDNTEHDDAPLSSASVTV